MGISRRSGRRRLLMQGLALGLLAVLAWLTPGARALETSDLYCGEQTCYQVLGVPQTASTKEIKKAFRALSLQYHPDKNPSPAAVDKFRAVANAYAVVTENREEYDDLLNNPDKFLQHQWRFYRYQYTHHHTAVWKVLLGVAVLATLTHWVLWRQRYFSLRRSMLAHPEIQRKMAVERERRLQILRASQPGQGLSGAPGKPSKARLRGAGRKDNVAKPARPGAGGSSQADLPPEPFLEAHPSLEVDLSDVAVVSGWQGRLPVWWRDNLLAQLFFWVPLDIMRLLWWYIRWHVLFTYLQRPYGPAELEYLTCQALRLSWRRWQSLPQEEREELVERELWEPENMLEWRREMKQNARRR